MNELSKKRESIYWLRSSFDGFSLLMFDYILGYPWDLTIFSQNCEMSTDPSHQNMFLVVFQTYRYLNFENRSIFDTTFKILHKIFLFTEDKIFF